MRVLRDSHELVVRCADGHETVVALSPVILDGDGVIVRGYAGSAADFCRECDAPVVETLTMRPVAR